MKRLLTRGALLLLLCALLAASGFADVKAEAVCQQDVLFCTDEGLMTEPAEIPSLRTGP